MEVLEQRSEAAAALEKIARDYSFEEYCVNNIKTNPKGEGFVGDICFVTLEDKKNGKSMDLVLKLASNDEKIRRIFPIKMCYKKETYFYSKILPEYQKLLKEVKNQTIFAPKCFYTSLNENQEILAFENLKTSGFEMFNKKCVFDHDHVKLIFEMYGRFHGLSFVLQKLKPEEFKVISESLQGVVDSFLEKTEKTYRGFYKVAEACLIPGKDDEIIEAFRRFQEKDILILFRDLTRESKHSVILHKDCWSNNMMFKYEICGSSKKLVDLRFLDFQIMRKGSPVIDLSYCLYTGGSKEIFDRLNDYLDIYHQSCSTLLQQFGMNIEEVFPFKALKEEWKEFALYGFMVSINILKLKHTNSEDVLELKDLDESGSKLGQVKYDFAGFTRRMRDVMKHVFEIGLLR